MTLTAGVIGCGMISRFHFSGLEKAGARIKWICDLSREAAGPWAKKFRARYTADYGELIADPETNVLVVAPVSSAHKKMCCAAIKAGKAVICEKTLAENADDALDIVRLAEEKQTIFYTSYMKRFIPAVEKAKELLPSLGRIISMYIRAYQPWGQAWRDIPRDGAHCEPPSEPSPVVKKYGGGILVCGGSHILDLVNFFLGRPKKLFATMCVPPHIDYDLQATALMETDNGIVHYEALVHTLGKIGFLRDGWDERIEITGVDGRLEIYSAKWDEVHMKSSLLIHYDGANDRATEYRYPPVSPFDRALEFFCKNIAEGTQGAQSRLTGYEVDELIAHIKKSAATGRALKIKWRI